eukprot:TRINITY_DN255_c2_g1_i2.p1 TRINITY_DN255_c2_g1~~TRINITY_DN255_c2_g1_i2.p1  ORF type:complete len:198 (-),score=75.47 TRINITY_DN255_c2_g1_i2:145-738(-)
MAKKDFTRKIFKRDRSAPTKLEQSIIKALIELETSESSLEAHQRNELLQLYFFGAKEIDCGGKRVIVITIPFRLLTNFRKIQNKLSHELEKKLGGKQVIILPERRMMSKLRQRSAKARYTRPNDRTLTAIHDAILHDIVYPTEITGKRIRVRLNGRRLFKIYLDKKDQHEVKHKIKGFSYLYKKLTGKSAQFLFPTH